MKKKICITFSVLIMAVASLYLGLTSKSNQLTASELVLNDNIEALASLEEINGTIYIIDEIPCSSGSLEINILNSYINCSTCSREKGQSDPSLVGKCTNIAIFP